MLNLLKAEKCTYLSFSEDTLPDNFDNGIYAKKEMDCRINFESSCDWLFMILIQIQNPYRSMRYPSLQHRTSAYNKFR